MNEERRNTMKTTADQIWALEQEMSARRAAVNDGENARNKELEAQFDLTNRDWRAAFRKACGDVTSRLHAENREWYAAERAKIEG